MRTAAVALVVCIVACRPAVSFEVDGWRSGQRLTEVQAIHQTIGQELISLGEDGSAPFRRATYISALGIFNFCQSHLISVTVTVPTSNEYVRLLHRRILANGSVRPEALTHPTVSGPILTVQFTWSLGNETYNLRQTTSSGAERSDTFGQVWTIASVCDRRL